LISLTMDILIWQFWIFPLASLSSIPATNSQNISNEIVPAVYNVHANINVYKHKTTLPPINIGHNIQILTIWSFIVFPSKSIVRIFWNKDSELEQWCNNHNFMTGTLLCYNVILFFPHIRHTYYMDTGVACWDVQEMVLPILNHQAHYMKATVQTTKLAL
jgi:hypothetical protein